MAQFARPDADQAAGSWTTTPLWSKVDEGSDGGDTIASEVVSNSVATTLADLRLSDVTDPVSSADHIIRARWASSSTRDITPFCELWLGTPGSGTLIATLAPAVLGDATEITDTYTLTGTEADNITDYTDLYLRLRGTGFGGGPSRSLVVEFCELETPDASSGTTFEQAVSGSMTPSGDLEKEIDFTVDGSLTPTGTITRLITQLLTGSINAVGSLVKSITKDFDGSVTPSGLLFTQMVIKQAVSGSSTPSGTIKKQINKILIASITPSGSLLRRIEKVLDGSLTPTGTVITAVVILVQLAGQIIITGALATLFVAGVAGAGRAFKVFSKVFTKVFIEPFKDLGGDD